LYQGKALIVGMFDPSRPGAFEIAYERTNLLNYMGFKSDMINVENFSIDLKNYLKYGENRKVLSRKDGLKLIFTNNYDIYFFQGITKEFLVKSSLDFIKKRGLVILDLPSEDLQYENNLIKKLIKLLSLKLFDIILVHSKAMKIYLQSINKDLPVYFLSYNITPITQNTELESPINDKPEFIYFGRGNIFLQKLINKLLEKEIPVHLIGTELNYLTNQYSLLKITKTMDSQDLILFLLRNDFISVINYDTYFMDQPQKVLRYIYCNIPFVSNRFLGILDFLDNNHCLYADGFDEYIKSLLELYFNKELRKLLKINLRNKAQDIITPNIAKVLYKIINA